MENPMQIFVLHTLPGCSGCRICEKVCSMRHGGTINPELSRIKIYQFYPGPLDIPIVCQYCSDHPCVSACPTKALVYDDEKFLMTVDQDLCNGCRLCHDACVENGRGGCITFHPREGYAQICDLCGGDPECVKQCPSDTLKFLPPSRVGWRLAKPPEILASRIAEQFWPAKNKIE